MTTSRSTRRGLLRAGAATGAVLDTLTIISGAAWSAAHTGFTNAPQGGTVTLGFSVPPSGPYADEGRTSCAPTTRQSSTSTARATAG